MSTTPSKEHFTRILHCTGERDHWIGISIKLPQIANLGRDDLKGSDKKK